MKKWLLATAFLCAVLASHAQFSKMPISISYFGENLIHPGLKVGIEYPIWEKEKTKVRRSASRQEKYGSKTKIRQLYGTGNLGFYNHPNNHSGLFLSSEIAYRRIKQRKGQILGVNLGIGYLLHIPNIDVFELDVNGNSTKVSGVQSQFMTIMALNYGYDLSVRRGLPMTWHIKPTLMFLTPYNHTYVPNVALELGVTYQFGGK